MVAAIESNLGVRASRYERIPFDGSCENPSRKNKVVISKNKKGLIETI
jgi:hypothetical protein